MKIRAVAYAIPSGIAAAATFGGISFLLSVLVGSIPGVPASLTGSPVFIPFAVAGILSIPYALLFLPIALGVSFYRAYLSNDPWNSLKRRLRYFAMLFAAAVFLWSSIWISGVYIA